MPAIPLRNRAGEVVAEAMVDDADFTALARYRWSLDSYGYAHRATSASGERRVYLMHREILGLTRGDGMQADHINRNRLDNRRSNLRVLTDLQQRQNRGSFRGSASRFRGVCRRPNGRWEAKAKIDHRTHYIGVYDTEDEAGAAAQAFRAEHMPYAVA